MNRQELIDEQVKVVLLEFEAQVNNADTIDTINKLYRQARVWNRFKYRFEQAYSKEVQTKINHKLKNIRKNALTKFTEEN